MLASLVEAWSVGDAHRAVAHFAPDGVYREARHEPLVGRDQLFDYFTSFFRDGPRWRFIVERIIVEGEHGAVAYRFAIEGAGGVWRERAGCALVRFAGALIAEWREYEG